MRVPQFLLSLQFWMMWWPTSTVQLVCIKQLAGKPVDEVLKNGDGILTVDDVKDLVCKILGVVFGALAPVVGLVQYTGLLKTLIVIVNLTCAFVQVVIEITGGFKGLLAYYLHAYVAVGAVPVVLSILHIPAPF
ncbi:hypothetical protein H4582DRAFT_1378412 [Lactarius indigo]|nr:hypothetical protein H4582DRAFT_1378412 [Lactarius indigo]